MREDIRQYLEDHAATDRGVFEGVEDCADLTDALRTSYATVQDYAASRVHPKRAAEFDRWLAAHDAEVAANAIREAGDESDRARPMNPVGVRVWLHNIADRIEREATNHKPSNSEEANRG